MRKDIFVAIIAFILIGTAVVAGNPTSDALDRIVDAINGVKAAIENSFTEPPAEKIYLGNSINSFDGESGVISMNQDCVAAWGPESHMCTSEEVMNTVSPPAVTVDSWAWVKPTIIAVYDASSEKVVDISGMFFLPANGMLSCNGWSPPSSAAGSAAGYGLAVNGFTGGQFSVQNCELELKVACCGPP